MRRIEERQDPMRDETHRDAPAKDEATVRRDLAAAYRLLALEGMDDGIYTHISAHLPPAADGTRRFLLNPFGLRFDEVTASTLVTVDETGAILDDPYGAGINAAGFTIHSAVHMARPDAGCVLHTHTVAGVAVSSVAEGLLPLNQWSAQFYGITSMHAYEGIALDLDERQRIIADLGDNAVLILQNHGMLTVGRSVAEATKLAMNLERSCRAQVAACGMGLTPVKIPEDVAAKTARVYSDAYDKMDANGQDPEWAAEMRRLDAIGSDYAA